MIDSHQYTSDPGTFYKLALLGRSILYFEYHNSGYEQLKSSGNLRLIRKKELADSLVDYYFTIQEGVSNQESRYMQATANIASAMWDILDSRYYTTDIVTPGSSLSTISIPDKITMAGVNEEKIMRYKNLCYEKMIIVTYLRGLVLKLNKRATTLLSALKAEYDFE